MINRVIEQYEKQDNLDIRVKLHKKYSKNKLGFNNWIFSNYQITDEINVLELGCGTGELWKSNLDSIDKMKQLVITDFSSDMVETTRAVIGNRDNVNYEIMDIQNVSFEKETFDIVIANMLLHHVNDIPKALSEVNRVLKNGGIFYYNRQFHSSFNFVICKSCFYIIEVNFANIFKLNFMIWLYILTIKSEGFYF